MRYSIVRIHPMSNKTRKSAKPLNKRQKKEALKSIDNMTSAGRDRDVYGRPIAVIKPKRSKNTADHMDELLKLTTDKIQRNERINAAIWTTAALLTVGYAMVKYVMGG